MKPIAIIGAMDFEIETLLSAMQQRQDETRYGLLFHRGTLNGVPAVVLKCGIGKVNAARSAQMLIDLFDPAALINTGIAGGLAPELSIGDIVVATSLLEHDFDVSPLGYVKGCLCDRENADKPTCFSADPAISSALSAAAETVLGKARIHRGTIVTGDQFIAGKEKKAELYGFFHGTAAEMEGGAIAHTAALSGVPFAVIRAISDLADGTASESYATFEREAAANSAAIVLGAIGSL